MGNSARLPSRLALLAFVGAGAVPALADDADMLLPREKVRAILAGGESRTIAVAGVEGSRCTLSVRAVGKSQATPRLDVVAPDGSPLGDRGRIRVSARGASARNFVVDATGVWRAMISTPEGRGGEVEVSMSARVPASRRIEGTTSGDPATGSASFPAFPGSVADVTVGFLGKSPPPIGLSLRAPSSGAEVAAADGPSGRASLRKVALASFGTYEVAVAGPGAKFRGTARTKLPPRRTGLVIDDVEAFPEITGISPTTVANDGARTLTVTGHGFSTRHRLQVSGPAGTAASGVLTLVNPTTARVDLDLEGDAPAVHEVAVTVPSGRRIVLPWTLEVTNLPAGVLAQIPREVSHEAPVRLRLDGVGFDAGAVVEVRRAADGLSIPSTSTTRTSHRLLETTLVPPQYAVGVCDVTIVDEDGTRTERPGTLDLLGARGPSGVARTLSNRFAYAPSAAFDDASGRLVVAVQDGSSVAFVLVDTKTWTVLDVHQPAGTHGAARVAHHPLDGTWALSWVDRPPSGSANQRGNLRITGGADLDDVRAAFTVADERYVDLVSPVPDGIGGGWHAYWTDATSQSLGGLKLLRVASDGVPDPDGPIVLESDPLGWLLFPSAAQRPDGRFVVAYLSIVDAATTRIGIVRRVVRADGTDAAGRQVCADEIDYAGISAPLVAAHPSEDGVCVGFTYDDGQRYRPASFVLAGASALPGTIHALAPEGVAPEGYLTGLVWNQERGEYVASMLTVDLTVTLRRINPDGSIRPAFSVQTYEGPDGVVWSGAGSGSLGLARLYDGTDDGFFNTGASAFQILLTPLR